MIKGRVLPGLRTEQYLTNMMRAIAAEHGEVAEDYVSGNDFIAAFLRLRSEGFFAKPELLEDYYMDEDVAESGFSMAHSVSSLIDRETGHPE